MTNRKLSLKILLPLISFLFLFLPFKTYAKEDVSNIFRYEKEVINQIVEKKEPIYQIDIQNILEYRVESTNIISPYIANTFFNKFETDIGKYNPIDKLPSFTPKSKPLYGNSFTKDYFFKIVEHQKENNPLAEVVAQFLDIESKKDITKPLLPKELVEDIFVKKYEINNPNYDYFLDIRASSKKEDRIYVKNLEEEIKIPLTESIKEQEVAVKKEITNTTTVKFSLTILPVRFVYVDSSNKIVKIWNNVKREDTEYALKFFNENDIEITASRYLNSQYFNIINQIDVFQQGTIYDINTSLVQRDYSERIHIQIKEDTSGTEEIYTLI